jgi:hypothetical protein
MALPLRCDVCEKECQAEEDGYEVVFIFTHAGY